MKKPLIIIALIIAIGILLYFLLSSGKDHDTHESEHAQVVATYDSVKAHDAVSARIIDSLKQYTSQQEAIIKDLISAQEETKGQLNNKAAEIKSLAAQVKAGNKDSSLNVTIDSLVAQINSLTFLLVQYEQYSDSLNNANTAQKENYAAIIAEKDKAKAELQAAYDQLYRLYDVLYKSNQGMLKDIKRERLKTKIAALLALVAGGAAAIK